MVSAIGTAWAALAASQSAAVSNKSLEVTERVAHENRRLAEATLKESQATNRRNIFEQRFSLLLEQHNFYHNKVCELIDESLASVNENGAKNTESPEYQIFYKRFDNDSLDFSLKYLTGHKVLSPYMRTLYHLLKFIDEEFYEPQASIKARKVYSSPLRSVIRNDILYLVAVNALNVQTESMQKSGYPKYQRLLHKFDFFEHAVFYDPLQPNVSSYDANPVNLLSSKLNELTKTFPEAIFGCTESVDVKDCRVNLVSPGLLCMAIYKNPFQKHVKRAVYKSFKSLWAEVHSYFERQKKIHGDCMNGINSWACGYVCYEPEREWFNNNRFRMKVGTEAIENGYEVLAHKLTGDYFVSSHKYIEHFKFNDSTTGSPRYSTLKFWVETIKKLRVGVDNYYAADTGPVFRQKLKQHARQQFKNNISGIFSYNILMR